jgi:hypothetical protein
MTILAFACCNTVEGRNYFGTKSSASFRLCLHFCTIRVMNSAKEKAIEYIKTAGGLIRTGEALERRIHRRTLYGLRDEGILIQVSRGLYQLAVVRPYLRAIVS